jgi:hypothetical protein
MRQSIRQFNDLLALPANAIEEWQTSVEAGDEQVPEEFNWLGLAEVAAFNASSITKQGLGSGGLIWARIAISTYQHLARQSHITSQDTYLNSAMNLRVFMINQLGSISGDSVLDMEQVLQWFLDGLTLTFEDVARKVGNWSNLDHDEVLKLRRIKNRITILEHLSKERHVSFDQNIKAWLSLRESLP